MFKSGKPNVLKNIKYLTLISKATALEFVYKNVLFLSMSAFSK